MSTFLNDLHKHSYDLDRQITKSLASLLLEPTKSQRYLQPCIQQTIASTIPIQQQNQSNSQLQNLDQIPLTQSSSNHSSYKDDEGATQFQQSYLRQREISKCIKNCQEMLNSLLLKSKNSASFTKKRQSSQHLGSVITKDDDESLASSRSSAIDECMNQYGHNSSNVSSSSNSLACTPRFLQSKQVPQNKSNSLNSSKQQDDSFRLLQLQQQIQSQLQQQQEQQKLLQVGIKVVNTDTTTSSNLNIRTLTASSSVTSFQHDQNENEITKRNQKYSIGNQIAPKIQLDSQKLEHEFQFREQQQENSTNSMMKQIVRLLHAVNAERKLFRDQNMKLLNKIALLQMQEEQAKIIKQEASYRSFTSRAYRMHQQIKDKRIEKLENQNKLLRQSGFSMATQCVELQNQINQFQETFQDRLKQAAILMSCQNINSPDQVQQKQRQFLHIPSQKN